MSDGLVKGQHLRQYADALVWNYVATERNLENGAVDLEGFNKVRESLLFDLVLRKVDVHERFVFYQACSNQFKTSVSDLIFAAVEVS